MLDLFVVKKRRQGEERVTEEWDFNKIISACTKSAQHIDRELTEEHIDKLKTIIENALIKRRKEILEDTNVQLEDRFHYINVYEVHNIVQLALKEVDMDIYESYHNYRDYKITQSKRYRELYSDLDSLKNGVYNENANKDSSIISTKRSLFAETAQKQFMIDFVLQKNWVKAHEEGWIYIHDLGDLYWRTFNCDNVDLANLIKTKKQKDGEYAFTLNGIKYPEPKSIESAFNLLADLILQMSSQQFGGFSVQNLELPV